jgi:hypothetical protein
VLRDQLSHSPGESAHGDHLDFVGQSDQGGDQSIPFDWVPTAEQRPAPLAGSTLAEAGVPEIGRCQIISPDRSPKCDVGTGQPVAKQVVVEQEHSSAA